ncbi:MAG: histidine phosphatase family protein [Clostridia bacterium]|nr:histidine phosphatase family protein [Clostridia bacterium]
MTRIILQRHGESMANARHVYAGQSDFHLSERGREQALLGARALAETHVDAIYSSSLARAYETAEPHAELRGLEIHPSDQLREIFLGEWESAERDFLLENYPYEAGFIWHEYFGLFRAPGGESAPAAGERFEREIIRIAKENPDATVLVTAHAAVIRLFWGRISGYEPHEIAKKIPFPSNASFSYVDWDGEKLIPVRYSDDDHIKSLGAEILK